MSNMKLLKVLLFFVSLNLGLFQNHWAKAEQIDYIVAIVEDEVILNSELQREAQIITQRLTANKVSLPPDNVLKRQVLERVIVDKLQRHLAKTSGINITNDMTQGAIADIARKNNMDTEQFKEQLKAQGMNYKDFEENVRHEIVINQLRGREIGGRINVTDSEVEHYLETQGDVDLDKSQYHLGHILIALPESASSNVIQKAKQRADDTVERLRANADFKQIAIEMSDGAQALQGGDLGWRTLSQMPTIFVDTVSKMKSGDISDPIRSPSGFHIVKLFESKGTSKQAHLQTKTKVRHILIKTNELVDDAEAKKRLLNLKARIMDGDSFESIARAHSEDKGSAIKGGDLGVVLPGAMVAQFETAMNNLPINQISEPVQTEFGWHLIQVLSRETQDNNADFKKNQAREAIRERKIEEETELWLRRLRDEAYVEIFQDRL